VFGCRQGDHYPYRRLHCVCEWCEAGWASGVEDRGSRYPGQEPRVPLQPPHPGPPESGPPVRHVRPAHW